MSVTQWIELARVIVVIALVIAAAVLATPKGRVPLALRGIQRMMRKDRGLASPEAPEAKAPTRRRLAAFALVLLAVLIALCR